MTPAAPAWLVWLEQTGPAVAMRTSIWMYPIVEIIHIVGLVLLVGSAFLFDLRLLGVSRHVPVSDMARHHLPRARLGLGVVVPSGLLMFAAHATAWGMSPVFRLKVVLIAAAIVNTLLFHGRTAKSLARWDRDAPTPPGGKAAAVVSLTLWTAAIAAGRLLAYF
ncbi:MAG: hypothetical protein QN190_13620 [Armatimonadota bacterium]|nr:hypothetical protein [Armatimonadota bacterium]MDR7467184.1 hypothetical protein [Armatimonadota bacterium]MDR7495197.1 hypothetical protein [Armatimonadota bacterium]